MSIQPVEFANGEFYHIIKRGIDKRQIFLDEEDHLRFVNSLIVFNDKQTCPWGWRAFWDQRGPTSLSKDYRPKKPLVEIHAFALVWDHFHLLLRQIIEGGVIKLIKKLGGYSYYFNKKYGRKGTLFEGKYRAVLIKNEDQLRNTFVYVHTNPIVKVESGWKDWKVKNPERAIKFLEKKYRWSSYWDYLKKPNFPRVTYRDFFLDLYEKDEKKIRKEVNSWIKLKHESLKDLERLKEITLE